jgi:L-threonylcarbamoyladenylate synthase
MAPASLERLVAVLRSGAPILVPTDTVYGIAADPAVPGSVAKVFALKGRPEHSPLPVLGADLRALERVARFDDRSLALASAFWPGPLTMVLRRAESFTFDLGGDASDTVAVRVPRSQPLRELLTLTGPLAVTSANPSGEVPAGSAEEASAMFGELLILRGEDAAGEASTVVSLIGAPEILRAGAVSLADIEDRLPNLG